MAGQFHRTIVQDLHSLIAAEWLEITKVKLEATIAGPNDLADLVAIGVLAIRREAHHFAFVAILAVANELANHGVDAAQRVRQEHAIENFNLVAFATRHHRRNEIAGTVVAETRGFLPGRTVVRAGNVRDVVFEMMLLKMELCRADVESLRQQRANVAHRFFTLTKPYEVKDLGRVGECVLYFLRQVRVAVLAHGYMFDVRNLRADCIQTCFDCKRGEPAEVLMTVQAFLGNGKLDFAVEHDRRRGVGMKHVEAQDEHELRSSPLTLHLWLDHSFRLGFTLDVLRTASRNEAASTASRLPIATD